MILYEFSLVTQSLSWHAGAAAIDGKFLVKIEIIGKNLFYFFGQSKDAASATDVVRNEGASEYWCGAFLVIHHLIRTLLGFSRVLSRSTKSSMFIIRSIFILACLVHSR